MTDKMYTVEWHIDLFADDPYDAVRQAREIQLDPESTAVVFVVSGEDVTEMMIDLDEIDEEEFEDLPDGD